MMCAGRFQPVPEAAGLIEMQGMHDKMTGFNTLIPFRPFNKVMNGQMLLVQLICLGFMAMGALMLLVSSFDPAWNFPRWVKIDLWILKHGRNGCRGD
jgi:hypothetical protein